MRMREAIRQAKARGHALGHARASWVFDGNTTDDTYRSILEGIDLGDPKVMDALDYSPLSGEWAGESIPEMLGDLIEGHDAGKVGVISDTFEQSARDAYWHEIERVAHHMLNG